MTHQQLQTIDADTLLSTTLPPTRFIIDRLLPQGLHILAGAPKVGKSWLALWLCLQVAQGTSVWDFPTHRGTVLYLCLEDSLTRIQSRLFQITDDAPEALHFATIAAGIGEGLEEQLTNFLTQHPDTSLVVIDTLQRIRTGSDSGNLYANDYTGFSCWVYKNYGKSRCTSHAIGWKTLNQLVLEDIRRNAVEARRSAQDYMEMLVSLHTEKQKAEVDRYKRELKRVDKRRVLLFLLSLSGVEVYPPSRGKSGHKLPKATPERVLLSCLKRQIDALCMKCLLVITIACICTIIETEYR